MVQKCILLTGARAPIALDFARLFAAEGHRVLAADTVPYHVCRFSRFVDKSFVVPSPTKDPEGFVNQLAQIAKEEEVDVGGKSWPTNCPWQLSSNLLCQHYRLLSGF